MTFDYFPDTDSLYIKVSVNTCADAREIARDVIIDFDESGRVVGIDIDQASKKLELKTTHQGREIHLNIHALLSGQTII